MLGATWFYSTAACFTDLVWVTATGYCFRNIVQMWCYELSSSVKRGEGKGKIVCMCPSAHSGKTYVIKTITIIVTVPK